MKNLKPFTHFGSNISESDASWDLRLVENSLSIDFKLSKDLQEYDLELDGTDFVSAESYLVELEGGSEYGLFSDLTEELSLVIYQDEEGDHYFQFFYGSTPLPTPMHNREQKREMASNQLEQPLPVEALAESRVSIMANILEQVAEMR